MHDEADSGGSLSGRDEPRGAAGRVGRGRGAALREVGVGRKPTDLELLLRLHCLQLWHNLGDPALEDAVHDRLSFQRFLRLDP